MPALNFKSQFVHKILSGEKGSTIRAYRKDGLDPVFGDNLYLYTGMRTKQCRRLAVEIAKRVRPITISQSLSGFRIRVGSKTLRGRPLLLLWLNEGFDSLGELLYFFRQTHGPQFQGLLIEWRPI